MNKAALRYLSRQGKLTMVDKAKYAIEIINSCTTLEQVEITDGWALYTLGLCYEVTLFNYYDKHYENKKKNFKKS